MNLSNLFEGAIDELERRRIEDLEAKMDDLARRAKESTDPKHIAALRHEFAKCKAERDSYHYVREAGSPAQQAAIAISMKEKHQKPKVDEHGGGGDTPRQWHAYVRSHRADEGWQDFNKVEPYEVCLAGKPVKTFDYYEDARRFHDNWKKKLYNQGEKEKADKITLNPVMKEGSMTSAADHATGPEFTGYWKGTDKGTPGDKMVGGMEEGAKVDRMAKHIEKSEKSLGHSKKDAESIAWATLNKRGYLDNANKKKHTESVNFMEWAVAQGTRFPNFIGNPEVYAQAREAFLAEGMSNALSNISRRMAQPSKPTRAIKNRENKVDTLKRQHFAEDQVEEMFGPEWQANGGIFNLLKEYGVPLFAFAAVAAAYGISRAAKALESSESTFDQLVHKAVKAVDKHIIHDMATKLHDLYNNSATAETPAINEIKKGQKDSNGYTKCWPGHHAAGTKTGKNGGQVRNCVPNESIEEADDRVDPIILKALERIRPGIQGNGGPGSELYTAAKEALAIEFGLLQARNNSTFVNYLNQLQDLYRKQHGVNEDWQKANKKDKTDGMSQKAVNAYKREHPGSKLKTAVTTKPSKLKKGSKASKRRKSYCSRSKGQMKMHNISCAKTPDKAICKARRRWNCESQEQFDAMLREAVEKGTLKPGQYYIWTVYFDDGTNTKIKVTKDNFDPKAYYAKKNKVVINVDYNWEPHNG